MLRPTLSFVCILLLACSRLHGGILIDLLGNRALSGWEFVTSPATDIASVCTFQADGTLAISGKPVGYIALKSKHENYRLHAEWRWSAAPANGGVLLHISSGPKDRQWPVCFQMQLKHTRAGDMLPMAGATCAELPAPNATQIDRRTDSSEKPPGEWNSCDIVCRDGTIECTVNGVVQNRITNCTPASGTIGFQLEGAPFELRNVTLSPLP